MSAYRRPDRCAWCCARLTSLNAAVVGDDLVCAGCAASHIDAHHMALMQRAAMKATARGITP